MRNKEFALGFSTNSIILFQLILIFQSCSGFITNLSKNEKSDFCSK
ncbi:MAG: hypothetical protein LBQ24_01545 [Candidatus Peribacteria bacterium]|nr:hypothetical protein [Candidatus Peribacteria bacterium]